MADAYAQQRARPQTRKLNYNTTSFSSFHSAVNNHYNSHQINKSNNPYNVSGAAVNVTNNKVCQHPSSQSNPYHGSSHNTNKNIPNNRNNSTVNKGQNQRSLESGEPNSNGISPGNNHVNATRPVLIYDEEEEEDCSLFLRKKANQAPLRSRPPSVLQRQHPHRAGIVRKPRQFSTSIQITAESTASKEDKRQHNIFSRGTSQDNVEEIDDEDDGILEYRPFTMKA